MSQGEEMRSMMAMGTALSMGSEIVNESGWRNEHAGLLPKHLRTHMNMRHTGRSVMAVRGRQVQKRRI